MQSWTCQRLKMCSHYVLFFGSVQFYAKFFPSCFSTNVAPFYKLLGNVVFWKWGSVEAKAFNKLKELVSFNSLMVHFDPTLPLGKLAMHQVYISMLHCFIVIQTEMKNQLRTYLNCWLHLSASTVRYRRNHSTSFLR